MKRIILFLSLTIGVIISGFSQSVEIQPDGDVFVTGSAPDLFIRARNSNSNAPELNTERSRVSGGSPAAVTNTTDLFRIKSFGYTGSSYIQGGDLLFEASETWDPGDIGTDFRLKLGRNDSGTGLFEWFTVKNSGNVGIGNSNPAAKLDVANSSAGNSTPSLRLLHSSATGYNRLSFENSARTDKFLISANVGSTAGASLWNVYHSATGNLITVNGDGDFGVRTNPDYTAHIKHISGVPGATGGNGLTIENQSASGTNNKWTFYHLSSGNLNLYHAGILRGAFNDGTGAYAAVSDRRLKSNINTMGSMLDKIMALRPSQYTMNGDDSNEVQFGLIAQEVQGIFPEITPVIETVSEGGGYDKLGISYSELIPVLIKGMQEQQEIIKNLKAEVEALKK